MKCERQVDKEGVISCSGQFCQPDSFDGSRIAQNFSLQELDDRLVKIEMDLRNQPKSCSLQAAYNQLAVARDIRKGMEGLN